jgi:hypothetical protein
MASPAWDPRLASIRWHADPPPHHHPATASLPTTAAPPAPWRAGGGGRQARRVPGHLQRGVPSMQGGLLWLPGSQRAAAALRQLGRVADLQPAVRHGGERGGVLPAGRWVTRALSAGRRAVSVWGGGGGGGASAAPCATGVRPFLPCPRWRLRLPACSSAVGMAAQAPAHPPPPPGPPQASSRQLTGSCATMVLPWATPSARPAAPSPAPRRDGARAAGGQLPPGWGCRLKQ